MLEGESLEKDSQKEEMPLKKNRGGKANERILQVSCFALKKGAPVGKLKQEQGLARCQRERKVAATDIEKKTPSATGSGEG